MSRNEPGARFMKPSSVKMSPKYCFFTIAHCFDVLENNT